MRVESDMVPPWGWDAGGVSGECCGRGCPRAELWSRLCSLSSASPRRRGGDWYGAGGPPSLEPGGPDLRPAGARGGPRRRRRGRCGVPAGPAQQRAPGRRAGAGHRAHRRRLTRGRRGGGPAGPDADAAAGRRARAPRHRHRLRRGDEPQRHPLHPSRHPADRPAVHRPHRGGPARRRPHRELPGHAGPVGARRRTGGARRDGGRARLRRPPPQRRQRGGRRPAAPAGPGRRPRGGAVGPGHLAGRAPGPPSDPRARCGRSCSRCTTTTTPSCTRSARG